MADRSFGGYAKRVIKRALKHLLRDGHSAVDAGDEDALHALRIDVKRLRYTIEFAAPLLAERGREPLALLALAQERLGALADADMFARTFGAMLGALATDDERVPGLQRLCDDAQRRREAALEGVRAIWQGEGGAPMSGQRSYPDKAGRIDLRNARFAVEGRRIVTRPHDGVDFERRRKGTLEQFGLEARPVDFGTRVAGRIEEQPNAALFRRHA